MPGAGVGVRDNCRPRCAYRFDWIGIWWQFTAAWVAPLHNEGASQEAAAAPCSSFATGSNNYGQLGDGTTEDRLAPVQVATDLVFVDITAGSQHTCGLVANGSYACWGKLPL